MIQKPRPTIMTDSHESKSSYRKLDEEFLHSAAIIDADGREIAITKEMIDLACDQLAIQIEEFQHSQQTR